MVYFQYKSIKGRVELFFSVDGIKHRGSHPFHCVSALFGASSSLCSLCADHCSLSAWLSSSSAWMNSYQIKRAFTDSDLPTSPRPHPDTRPPSLLTPTLHLSGSPCPRSIPMPPSPSPDPHTLMAQCSYINTNTQKHCTHAHTHEHREIQLACESLWLPGTSQSHLSII